MHFLVCVPAISAQIWRYHRFVTGTILPHSSLTYHLLNPSNIFNPTLNTTTKYHSSHWSFYLTCLDPHPEAWCVERKEKRIYSLSYIGGINCRKSSDDCGCDLAVAIGITNVCDDCFEVWALKVEMVWRKRKEFAGRGWLIEVQGFREILKERRWQAWNGMERGLNVSGDWHWRHEVVRTNRMEGCDYWYSWLTNMRGEFEQLRIMGVILMRSRLAQGSQHTKSITIYTRGGGRTQTDTTKWGAGLI